MARTLTMANLQRALAPERGLRSCLPILCFSDGRSISNARDVALESVTSFAVTRYGRHAISGSRDGTIKVWELGGL